IIGDPILPYVFPTGPRWRLFLFLDLSSFRCCVPERETLFFHT
ncbi:hypothetical protein CSUI_004923, partial [Cystoisospora suis]